MIREGDGGRHRVFAVVPDYGVVELGHFRIRADAEAAEEKAVAIEQAGGECAAVFADKWITEFPRPSAGSNRVMSYNIRRFARDFGERQLGEVTPREARAWTQAFPSSATFARALYEDAISIGLVTDNPFRGVRIPSSKRNDLHLPSQADLDAMIAATPGPIGDIIGLAAYTGLRLGELLGLAGKDVGERTIRIERQRHADSTYALPKWGVVREIALLPRPARTWPRASQCSGSRARPFGNPGAGCASPSAIPNSPSTGCAIGTRPGCSTRVPPPRTWQYS